ncbi:hypothetical protein KFK09_006889 [Dendrobium nobile]|uniref:t-SNARE coiled-coil homology domain-containing protein n=1 Tax=Dendrobium nobile TaxID=94219 RepID=A0A8T3BUV6_DENNO|nr:hypothetical protein KFK09_006889 [Dendrobium nobile]
MTKNWQESFERIRGRYPGESDIESGGLSPDIKDANMEEFFKQVGEIDKQIEKITTQLSKLQAANQECQRVTKASAMKEIKGRMEKDIEEVRKIALSAKRNLEELDKDNIANRKKAYCAEGSAVDRSRVAVTVALKRKLKDRMSQFQILRQTIQEENRETVERMVYTVTGTRPTEEMIEHLIETGDSEQIFSVAIQGQGRGQIVDVIAEIQERRDAAIDLEKKLLDLQQMFFDMAVLVDAQGDLLDDIETQVASSLDHVQTATVVLQDAKKLKKNTRKHMCFAIVVLLIIIIVALSVVLKQISRAA